MHRLWWALGFLGTLCMPSNAQSAYNITPDERAVLDRALIMTGLQATRLPIVLTSELPVTGSIGAEAWTVYDEDGKGDRIFVYTQSRAFRCASVLHRDQYQCLLKLASVIVHEAWHLRKGPDEATAYRAQLAFLEFNHASGSVMTEVRDSRRRVLAEKRGTSKRPRTDSP